MTKKILLLFIIFSSFFVFSNNTITNANSNDLTSKEYKIKTNTMWVNKRIKKDTAKKTAQSLLSTIIEKIMIAFWTIALFVMTVGWWFMVFSHWKDELLNKWKTMFTAWVISLAVALSSWIIMKVVISLLY